VRTGILAPLAVRIPSGNPAEVSALLLRAATGPAGQDGPTDDRLVGHSPLNSPLNSPRKAGRAVEGLPDGCVSNWPWVRCRDRRRLRAREPNSVRLPAPE
jgi:hypothetical protein